MSAVKWILIITVGHFFAVIPSVPATLPIGNTTAHSEVKKAQPILYGWNKGRHYFMDHNFEADVWEIASRGAQSRVHPNQKPLGLIQRTLRNSSKPKEIVLDPFAGSGSTIIAAEREGRVTYAMDLDPIYIDVIIRRYAALGAQTEEEIRATKRQIPQEKPK